MCYPDVDQFRNLHMTTYRNCYMLIPASFKLALMWCSCMHHLLPWVASYSLAIHHIWLSIMSCLCVVCLPCCLLLSGCGSSRQFLFRCDREDSFVYAWFDFVASSVHLLHGLVLLPCGISGKMTATLDLTTIIAMLVASFYRYAALPITCLSSHPKLPWTSNLWHPSYANHCLAMLPLCSALL